MKQTDLEKLLADMSLKEKVDQMLQLSGAFYLGDENSVLTGPANDMGIGKEDLEMAGSILGAAGADTMKKLQDDYMAKQPHHIPMLFMMDVIHGMKTIFPAPLAQGATFDPELSGECASAAAKEASAAGLHVTFSPMVDLVRDARWGRVVESTGEDPYLNSRFSEAIVKGFQGDDLKTPGKVASCIKHFAGYGGAVAGRDYNTVELSEHTFREFYLPAYKAGIDAGAAMVMTSFNTINGVPASTNKWLMRDILRGEMGFDGVLISDFAAILETVAHRSSKDAADAAKKALEAGVDIDMMTSVYAANLCRMVEDGEVEERLIDECCLRILELKNKLGLFENPYKDADAEKEKEYNLCPEHRALAKKAAEESFVLLKNDGILPLDTTKKIAFVGPYTDNHEIKSSWSFTGDSKDCVTIREAAEKVFDASRTSYDEGCPVIGNDVELIGFTETTPKKYSGEAEIVHIGNKDIRGCVACGACSKLGKCAFSDMVNEVAPKFEEADGLVVGSPVYYASANATLIAFLDRLFYSTHFDKTMKVGASVVSARRGGLSATFDELNKYFTISGMPVASGQYWNSIHGNNADEAQQDLEGLQIMRTLARNMSFLMKSIQLGKESFGLPEKEPRVGTNFIR